MVSCSINNDANCNYVSNTIEVYISEGYLQFSKTKNWVDEILTDTNWFKISDKVNYTINNNLTTINFDMGWTLGMFNNSKKNIPVNVIISNNNKSYLCTGKTIESTLPLLTVVSNNLYNIDGDIVKWIKANGLTNCCEYYGVLTGDTTILFSILEGCIIGEFEGFPCV